MGSYGEQQGDLGARLKVQSGEGSQVDLPLPRSFSPILFSVIAFSGI